MVSFTHIFFEFTQFTLRQKGEKNQLSDDRVSRLEEIGFSWTAPSFRKKKETPRGDYTHVAAHHPIPPPLPPPPHDFRRWL